MRIEGRQPYILPQTQWNYQKKKRQESIPVGCVPPAS